MLAYVVYHIHICPMDRKTFVLQLKIGYSVKMCVCFPTEPPKQMEIFAITEIIECVALLIMKCGAVFIMECVGVCAP
jgi:hypothetical protein